MSRPMKAVVIANPGGPDQLRLSRIPVPIIGPDEVLIKVAAAGVNRYDLLQREGLTGEGRMSYLIPGLECSGWIIDVGTSVIQWQVGDQIAAVCAFLRRGGYAEEVAVPAGQILPLPDGFSLVDSACLPELAYTTWLAVSIYGKLHPTDIILIHEGCGQIGMLALLLAVHIGARVYVTADTKGKLKAWKCLGAHKCFVGNGEEIASQVMEETKGRGANVILVDQVANLKQNLKSIALGGAIVVVQLHGGLIANVSLPHLIQKNCKIKVLDPTKRLIDPATVVMDIREHIWEVMARSSVIPLLDYQKFDLSEAANAHRHMEMAPDCWKAILTTSGGSGDEPVTSQIMQDAADSGISSWFSSLNLRRRR